MPHETTASTSGLDRILVLQTTILTNLAAMIENTSPNKPGDLRRRLEPLLIATSGTDDPDQILMHTELSNFLDQLSLHSGSRPT